VTGQRHAPGAHYQTEESMAATPLNSYLAVDPIVFVLHGRALEIYWEKAHPHTPLTAAVAHAALKEASPDELRATAARAKAMADIAAVVLKATETLVR
jgi:hypothetical protein